MKKISYLEASSLLLTIIITFNLGVNLYLLKNNTGIDSWLTILLAYLIGLIPLSLTLYIDSYKPDLTIYEKNIHLFGKIGTIINIMISLIIFIIAITILYNVTSFINTQFLYHTPIFLTSLLLIALSIYATSKGINVISHISIILMTGSIILFFLSTTSLVKEVNLDYLLPILKTNHESIFLASLKLAIINTLPVIIILIIPKNSITNPQKYHKSLIITYLFGALISFIITTTTITTLNIYLTKAFEYAEYIALKKIKLLGFLERVENIISIKWITESFIYLTLIIYTITQNKKIKYNYIPIGITILLTTTYLFPSITTFNNYLETTFIYLISILIPIYLIITLKIIITKKNS